MLDWEENKFTLLLLTLLINYRSPDQIYQAIKSSAKYNDQILCLNEQWQLSKVRLNRKSNKCKKQNRIDRFSAFT